MDKLHRLSHNNVKQMIGNIHNRSESVNITNDLAVAREVPVNRLVEHLNQTPVLLTEMRVVLVKCGYAEITINLKEEHVKAGDLIFLGEGGMVQWKYVEEGSVVSVISLSNVLFNLAFGNVIPKSFDGRYRDFHFHIDSSDFDFLDHIHLLLHTNINTPGHSEHVTQSLICSFLWHVDLLRSKKEENEWSGQTREQRIFAEFLQLVSKHSAENHFVDFYAERLFLSPRYMSTLVKKVSGRTAKEWIDDAIVARVKVTLKYTDKQISQISDEMCFPNTSFFCKFFKRLTGLTPLQYRLG